MTDWTTTISALATGAGTLVLAVATFASVRSANRTARTAEESMHAGMRPVLMNSRFQDPVQKMSFVDGRWMVVPGGSAIVEATDSAIYLVISVRNAGTGMGILHGWRLRVGRETARERPSLAEFTPQTRDMYVAPADLGFWQGALRDPDTEQFAEVAAAIKDGQPLQVDLVYGDFEGGQRVVSRFSLTQTPFMPREQGEQGAALTGHGAPPGGTASPGGAVREAPRWIVSVARHWNVDRPDPRSLDPSAPDPHIAEPG